MTERIEFKVDGLEINFLLDCGTKWHAIPAHIVIEAATAWCEENNNPLIAVAYTTAT